MIHKMRLQQTEFDNIIYNNKRIEVRLNDYKRQNIKVGDEIIFYEVPDFNRSIIVKVIDIYNFESFRKLYGAFSANYFGYSNLDIDEMLKKIYSIYSKDQEEEYGVIGIQFEVNS